MSIKNNVSDSFKEINLTPRQRNLLFAVIKEYCEGAEGIGSKEIQQKYNFSISSATIRNEFIKLRDYGYLYQPFTNAPNIPTEKAFKMFINQLITGLQITNKKQQELQRHILELEQKQLNLNKEISRLIASQAGAVGFSLDQDSETFSGISNLLTAPSEGKITDILNFLDNLDKYKIPLLENNLNIIENTKEKLSEIETESLKTVIGGDNPILPLGKGYSLVATEVFIEDEKKVVGIIAPTHLIAREQNIQLISTIGKTLKKKNKKDSLQK